MTSKLTREWLQHQISEIEVAGITDSNTLAAFKLALAAMGSEPVAWEVKGILCHTLDEANKYVGTPEPLYRHAQQPVVMDDTKLRELFDSWFASDCSFDLSPEASEADNIAWRESYWYVWQRCRAAMLQAQSDDDGEPTDDERIMAIEGIIPPISSGNSPVIPDGWIPCCERLPPEGYEPGGGAVCYIVWPKNEVNIVPQCSISNVFFLRKHWETHFTHWMPLPAAPQELKP